MISLADLLAPQTREDAKTSIYNAMSDLGLPVTGWKSGAWVRTIVSCVAVVLEAGLQVQNKLTRAGFREYVQDRAWAVLNATQVYGYTPRDATFASGTFTLDNAGGNVYNDVQPGELVVQCSSTKKNYTNTAVFSIGALETGVDVAGRAIESGSGSSVSAAGINTLVTAYLGLSVTNAEAWVGLDEETIAEINVGCDEQLDSLSPDGPAGAYASAAKKAVRTSDGTNVGVTRTKVSANSSTGEVTLYCATATGGITGDALDPDTDLGAIAVAMQAWAVPLGVTALPDTATTLTFAIEYTAVYETTAGITTGDRETLNEIALGVFMATEPIGGREIPPADGKVFHDAIEGVIRNASPGCVTVNVTTPAADTTLTTAQVPVLGVVTHNVSEVSP